MQRPPCSSSPSRFWRSIALGAILVALLAGATALSVLPAALAALGRRVDALALRRWRQAASRAARPASAGFWYRLAQLVMRAPGRVAAASAVVLLALATPSTRIATTAVDYNVVPTSSSDRQVAESLAREHRSEPILLAAEPPAGTPATAAQTLAKRVDRLPGTASVSQPQLLRRRALRLEARTASTRLDWDAPATTITAAGLHGGAGTTTLCLLLAQAIATFGDGPALAVDLAGRGRGGLAVLAGAAGQTTAEGTCAAAAIHGGRLERPFGVTPDGVRIIGAHPDGVEELDRSHETLTAPIVEAVSSGANDARLAELARFAVREDRSWRALRWDNQQLAGAVGRVLDEAAVHHALVAVDLGMLDADQLATVVGARSHLHVWVVPSRARSLEIAARRLPLLSFEPGGGEAIAVWQSGEASPSAKRLSALGDLRGCPVVRVANYGDSSDELPARMHRCLSGVTELCELAR